MFSRWQLQQQQQLDLSRRSHRCLAGAVNSTAVCCNVSLQRVCFIALGLERTRSRGSRPLDGTVFSSLTPSRHDTSAVGGVGVFVWCDLVVTPRVLSAVSLQLFTFTISLPDGTDSRHSGESRGSAGSLVPLTGGNRYLPDDTIPILWLTM